MEYWEFLIQKEGDRAWLPLESPTVEILEGRYRIVARSSYVQTAVEVRIAFLPEDAALGGRQRVQKRAGQTNEDGVLAIVPYTLLRPGRWQFRCSALEEAPWFYGVELQVLSVESDLWLEPIAPMEGPQDQAMATVADEENNAAEVAAIAVEASDSPASSISPASIDQSLIPEVLIAEDAIAETLTTPETTAPAEPEAPVKTADGSAETVGEGTAAETAETAIAPPPLEDRAPEAPAEPSPPEPSDATAPAPPPPSEPSPFVPPRDRLLQGTGDRLVRVADRLAQGANNVTTSPPTGPAASATPEPRPPLPITLSSDRLRLTLDHSTYVTGWGQPLTLDGTLAIVGERHEATTPTLPVGLELQVSLRDPATQRMVVCLSRPLHNCALGATDANALPLPCPFALDVDLPVESQGFLLLGHVGLYRATAADDAPLVEQTFTVAADATLLMRAIDPTFSPERCTQTTPVQRPSPSGRLPFQANASALDTQLLNFVSSRNGRPDQPALPPPPLPSSVRSRPAPTLPGERPQPTRPPAIAAQAQPQTNRATEPPAPPPSATGANPSGANSSGANSSHSSPLPRPTPPVKPAAPPPLGQDHRFWGRLNALADDRELEQWLANHDEGASPPLPEPRSADAALVQREIVLETEPAPPRSPLVAADAKALAALPVPTPRLSVATDPLVGGQPAIVRVRVADTGAQLLVKFWVQDRQTRDFIVMPQWLSQMRPNGLDELEAKITLNLPPDLLEVTLQAITMDASTNRQSHRAELVATVVPAFERRRETPLPDPLGIDLFELPRSQRRDR